MLVTGEEDGKVLVSHRAGVDPMALVELRRFVNKPLSLEPVDDEQFEELLAGTYEQGSSEAMQMMGDIGDDMDVYDIAQHLPEPEDLLESEDDAPIIRLINALLTEAVKENASDIHIEPFENRLVVRFRCDGVLREVLDQEELLTREELALATIHLASAERLAGAAEETERVRDASSRAARTEEQALTRRLANARAENEQLRRDLAEAEQKLEAITSIERSIREQQ